MGPFTAESRCMETSSSGQRGPHLLKWNLGITTQQPPIVSRRKISANLAIEAEAEGIPKIETIRPHPWVGFTDIVAFLSGPRRAPGDLEADSVELDVASDLLLWVSWVTVAGGIRGVGGGCYFGSGGSSGVGGSLMKNGLLVMSNMYNGQSRNGE